MNKIIGSITSDIGTTYHILIDKSQYGPTLRSHTMDVNYTVWFDGSATVNSVSDGDWDIEGDFTRAICAELVNNQ